MTRHFLPHALGGQDILAACGQLKSESERMRKVDRMAFEAMMIAGHGEE